MLSHLVQSLFQSLGLVLETLGFKYVLRPARLDNADRRESDPCILRDFSCCTPVFFAMRERARA